MKETTCESISFVISPLTLLIKDQQKNLIKTVVIAAEFIGRDQSNKEVKKTMCSVSVDIFHFEL